MKKKIGLKESYCFQSLVIKGTYLAEIFLKKKKEQKKTTLKIEQKQWDYRLRNSVEVEETLEIHLPTVQRAERILPSKDSESCWEGGVIFALMWGNFSPLAAMGY